MRPILIFIGGAPGIGKTTVARELCHRLVNSAWLDGDDVWRTHPFRVDDTTKAMVEDNIQHVLRGFLKAGFSYVLLSWVMHEQALQERILSGLNGIDFQFHAFTLVCDAATLAERFNQDSARGPVTELALNRLRQSRALETIKIDVAGRNSATIVHEIARAIGTDEAPGNQST